MAADDPMTTGTPEEAQQVGNAQEATGTAGEAQDGGNAEGVEQAQGTMSEAEREELEALRRQKQQHLAEKSNYERDRQELERLRSASTPPTAQGGGYNHEAALLAQKLAEKTEELRYRATVLQDSDALFQLALMEQNNQLRQQFEYRTQIMDVDKQERQDAERVMREAQMRGEYITPQTAARIARLERLESQAATLTTKEQELNAAQAARSRGVVATRTVGVPRSELTKNEMTGEEFERQWASLDEAGRDKLNAAINSRQVRIIG